MARKRRFGNRISLVMGKKEYDKLKQMAKDMDIPVAALIRLVLKNLFRSGDINKYVTHISWGGERTDLARFNVFLANKEYDKITEMAWDLGLNNAVLLRLILTNLIRSGDIEKYIKYE